MQKRVSNEMWGTAIPVMSDAATCGLYTCQQSPGHKYIQSQTYLCPQHSLCIARYQYTYGQVAVSDLPLSPALALHGQVTVSDLPLSPALALHGQVAVSDLPLSPALALHGQVAVSDLSLIHI